jgi:hypothetical protein
MPSVSGGGLRQMLDFGMSDLRFCGVLRQPCSERVREPPQNGHSRNDKPVTCSFAGANRWRNTRFPATPVPSHVTIQKS